MKTQISSVEKLAEINAHRPSLLRLLYRVFHESGFVVNFEEPDLYGALCAQILSRAEAERFWYNFELAAGEDVDNPNCQAVAEYLARFFDRIKLRGVAHPMLNVGLLVLGARNFAR
ncbi:MAG TPA: hypothetical protein VJI33_01670 [Candidatus Paceibacterota bacterium]